MVTGNSLISRSLLFSSRAPIETHLKYHISRVVHPKVLGRVAYKRQKAALPFHVSHFLAAQQLN